MDIVHTHIHPHTQRFMGVWDEATLTVPGGKGLQVAYLQRCLREARKSLWLEQSPQASEESWRRSGHRRVSMRELCWPFWGFWLLP